MPLAFVTGALGGIGRVTCKVLKDEGYTVIGAESRDNPDKTKRLLRFDLRDLARPSKDSARIMKQIIRKIRQSEKKTGEKGLHLLVNNAACQILGNIDDLGVNDMIKSLETNVVAPFVLAKELLPELERAGGSIVNVASIHYKLTKATFVAYATSKGALVTLTKALAVELGGRGVRVNAVVPAATDTPLLRAGLPDKMSVERLGSFNPMGRIARPEEVANVIAFLASAEASYMNGATLEVDGGIGGRLNEPA